MTLSGPADVLRMRAAYHGAELRRVEDVVAAIADPAVGGAAAGSPIADHFGRLLAAARDRLAGAAPAGPVTARDWERLAEARDRLGVLVGEVLAYVYGRLLAERGLDGGATAAAERLIASLTERTGIDRPALLGTGEGDCIDHTASVVHFRPLGTTVWQLPVLAHELGHHVARTLSHRELPGTTAVSGWLAEEFGHELGGDPKRVNAWLHELFADVYATYALGTAYPLTVMAARVAYDRPAEADGSHPSWCRRIATMIAALRGMADLPGVARSAGGPTTARSYRDGAQWLAQRWGDLTGGRPDEGVDAEAVERQAGAGVRLLDRHALPRLRYVAGPVARLSDDLARPDATLPAGATPAQVINAAWTWRLRHPEADDSDVNARALARCAMASL